MIEPNIIKTIRFATGTGAKSIPAGTSEWLIMGRSLPVKVTKQACQI
jgi:hypothetical protein